MKICPFVGKCLPEIAFKIVVLPAPFGPKIPVIRFFSKLHEIFKSVIKRQEDKIDPIRSKFGKIEKDEINLEEKQNFIEEYVRNHRRFSFRGLLEKQGSKMEIIVTFLAILEMMKQGIISIEQEENFSDIIITSSLAA